MVGYIYLTTNLINAKKYIGKHVYDGQEIDPKYLGSGKTLKQAIQKYGKENFKCEVLEWCNSIEELNRKEQYWINLCNATNNKEYYNIAIGGTGGPIIDSLTSEQKNKIYEKRRETWTRNNTCEKMGVKRRQYYKEHPEAKIKISKGLKKFYREHPEIGEQISNRQKGSVWSPERRSHQTVLTGEKHPFSKACVCIETQEIFCSATEAAQKYGGSYKVIWKCCKGQCQTAAGFHWAFKDDVQRQKEFNQYVGQERKIFRKSKIGYKN